MNKRRFLVSAMGVIGSYFLNVSLLAEKCLSVFSSTIHLKPVNDAKQISFCYTGSNENLDLFIEESKRLAFQRVQIVFDWTANKGLIHSAVRNDGRYLTSYSLPDSKAFQQFHNELFQSRNKIADLRKKYDISLVITIS